MRRILRSFGVHFLIVWFIAISIGGIDFGGALPILAYGAGALTLADSLLKPFINLLLLPFNLVTLGVFRWVSNVVTLYIATALVPGFSVVAFTYEGLATPFIVIPSVALSVFFAYILLSFVISILSSILFWLVK